MPYYDYHCDDCHCTFEIQQNVDAVALQYCPVCGGYIRKVIPKVPIIFKGPGFYSTDNKKGRQNKNP